MHSSEAAAALLPRFARSAFAIVSASAVWIGVRRIAAASRAQFDGRWPRAARRPRCADHQERPEGGDFARDYDHVVDGTGAHFVWLNRGKESLAVDLKSPEGRDAVRRLVDQADVFMQNLAPGAAERFGFGARELREHRPELIVVNLSGYGIGGSMEQPGRGSATAPSRRTTPSPRATGRC